MTFASDQTLSDRWADWLATTAPRRLSPATIRDYCRQLRFFAEWMESTLSVELSAENMTPYRIRSYLSSLESHVQRHERQPPTYNKAVAALVSFGRWLLATDHVAINPAQGLRTIAEQPGPVKALERDVIVKILDAAHHTGDLRDALVVELLAQSGMRANEVATLQLEQ